MSTSPEEKIKQAKALTRKYMREMEMEMEMERQSQRPICHMRFIPYWGPWRSVCEMFVAYRTRYVFPQPPRMRTSMALSASAGRNFCQLLGSSSQRDNDRLLYDRSGEGTEICRYARVDGTEDVRHTSSWATPWRTVKLHEIKCKFKMQIRIYSGGK